MHSERTIYTYIGKGLLSASNLDLARKVRFRPRKSRHDDFKVDKACRTGRTYEDYLAFMAANPDTRVVQMDTVYGRKEDGKCLLTIHFTDSHFMLVYLLGARTARSVADVFRSLRGALGNELFATLFMLILTDNGSEFSDPKTIECDDEGELLTQVYYCEPRMSQQKGAVENNHIMIRYILPKGTSFEGLTQADASLLMNHINSYGRATLNDHPPHFIFECMFGDETLKKIGAELVPPDNVTLRPLLLKH
jgi:IS30 family transposase